MRVAILTHAVTPSDPELDRDVLVQAQCVRESLLRLGHETASEAITLDLRPLVRFLRAWRPDVVFNLVESLGGTDALMPVLPAVLDALKIPYTGAPTAAIAATTDKLHAKTLLADSGLPTPPWIDFQAPRDDFSPDCKTCIIKPVAEHGSLGMDELAVVTPHGKQDLASAVRRREALLGRPCFAERFIEGRELNISLLEGPGKLEILPPAEIEFARWPPDRPRIVGYAAKWNELSSEFQQSPRRFDLPEHDLPLLNELARLARGCWRLFGLRGYARVDFRVDGAGRPWIIDVNVNPCLSPDAGFAAALERAEIPFDVAMARILDVALAGVRESSYATTWKDG